MITRERHDRFIEQFEAAHFSGVVSLVVLFSKERRPFILGCTFYLNQRRRPVKAKAKTIIYVFFALIANLEGTRAFAYDTVLPDFSGAQAEFSSYQTRISEAMLQGPNFAQNYTLITIGCGTICRFGFVGNNETGELYSLPYGGEENSQMQLEYERNSNLLRISYRDNPLLETADGWKFKYEFDESPCAAHQLRFAQGNFLEQLSREVASYGRDCPTASKLFEVNDRGLSAFEEECFTEFARINVCDEAKRIAQESQGILPYSVDAELSVLSLVSRGPKLLMTSKWDLSRSELNSRLTANNMTLQQLIIFLERAAKDNVCSSDLLSAYHGLGGVFEYSYIDRSYSVIHSFEIRSCN